MLTGGRVLTKAEFVWLGLGIILLTNGLRPALESDGLVRANIVRDLVDNHAFPWRVFSIVQPALASPLYFFGGFRVLAYFNLIVLFAVGGAITFLVARREGWDVARRAALLLLCASMFPYHLGQFYSEVFGSLTVILGILLAPIMPWLAAIPLALGTANVPASAPGAALAILWLAFRLRRPSLVVLAGVAFGAPFIETILTFGALSSPYLNNHGAKTIMPYSGLVGFSYPLLLGLYNIVFSSGRGILFFVPGYFAFLWPSATRTAPNMRAEYEAMIVFVLGLILVYSRWWGWYGGGFWGPRFFLAACLPASLALAWYVTRPGSWTTVGLVLITVAIQTWGTVLSVVWGEDPGAMKICGENAFALEVLCWNAPEFSVLFRMIVVGPWEVRQSMVPFAEWAGLTAVFLGALCFCNQWIGTRTAAATAPETAPRSGP